MNFNNPLYRNMMNNMNPDMMKQACSNIENMPDDQIKKMMEMSGMGNMDIGMFKQMSKQMSGSSNDDLNRMKSNAQNMYGNQSTNTTNGYNRSNTTNYNTTSTPNSNTNNNNSNNHASKTTDDILNDALNRKTNEIERLERIKNQGNQLFKEKKYSQAKEKYYELISNISGVVYKEGTKEYLDLKTLTVATKNNIAFCFLKLEDYDLAAHECNKILKEDDKNFKANYRCGLAYYYKKQYVIAKDYFDQAVACGTEEDKKIVKDYLKEVEKNLGSINNDNKNSNTCTDNNKSELNNDTVNDTKNIKKKSIVQSVLEKELKNTSTNDNARNDFVNKDIEDDSIKIEDTSRKQNPILKEYSETPNYSNLNNNNSFNSMPFDEKTFNEKRNMFEKMDDTQLDYMTNMFSSMDTNTIKTMMKAQGMDISEEQINLMRNKDLIKTAHKQMKENPDLVNERLKYMKPNLNTQANINSSNSGVNANINTNYRNDESISSIKNNNDISTSNNAAMNENNNSNPFANMANMPGLGNMGNMDMKSMMDFVSKNPDILKTFFGNNKDGKGSGMPPQFETIMWLISLPHKIKSFCTSPKGLLIIGLFIYLIYSYFWG